MFLTLKENILSFTIKYKLVVFHRCHLSDCKDFLSLFAFENIHQTPQSTHVWGLCLEAKDQVQNEKENAGRQRYLSKIPQGSSGSYACTTCVPCCVPSLNWLMCARIVGSRGVPWEAFIGHLICQASLSAWICWWQSSVKKLTEKIIRRVSDFKQHII